MKRIVQLVFLAALYSICANASALDITPRYVHLYNSSSGQHYTLATSLGTETNQVYFDGTLGNSCSSRVAGQHVWWIVRCSQASITATSTSIHWSALDSELGYCKCADGYDYLDCDNCSDFFEPYIVAGRNGWGMWEGGRASLGKVGVYNDNCPQIVQLKSFPWGGYYWEIIPNLISYLRMDYT